MYIVRFPGKLYSKLSDFYTLSQNKLPENHSPAHTQIACEWVYPPPPLGVSFATLARASQLVLKGD